MKNTMIRSLSLFSLSLMMALSVAAQEEPKVKTTDKENKYKWEDAKIKEKKDENKYKSDDVKIKDKKDEDKYKSEDLKVKAKKEETKYKSDDLKIKDEKDERKVKATVKPMQRTMTEKTMVKTGETRVKTTEHMDPVEVAPIVPEPAVTEEVAVPLVSAPVKKAPVKKCVAKKSVSTVHTVAKKPSTAPRYIVRTKVVRDTVFVPGPTEKVVQKEYVHDTVSLTRVDTVIKVQTSNTYTGYSVPRGDFKKVKLKKDKDGDEVHMKRKEKD